MKYTCHVKSTDCSLHRLLSTHTRRVTTGIITIVAAIRFQNIIRSNNRTLTDCYPWPIYATVLTSFFVRIPVRCVCVDILPSANGNLYPGNVARTEQHQSEIVPLRFACVRYDGGEGPLFDFPCSFLNNGKSIRESRLSIRNDVTGNQTIFNSLSSFLRVIR